MVKNYKTIAAIGQNDETMCWAASLEWWQRAHNMVDMRQDDVTGDYLNMRGDGGTLDELGIVHLIEDPRWCMRWVPYYSGASLTSSGLKSLLSSGPLYVGYFDNAIQSFHVNCIYKVKGSGNGATVSAMEPHYKKIDPADDLYQGAHVKRRLDYYTGKQVHIGAIRSGSSANDHDMSYYY